MDSQERSGKAVPWMPDKALEQGKAGEKICRKKLIVYLKNIIILM